MLTLVVENVLIVANETTPFSDTVENSHKIDDEAEDRSLDDHSDSTNLNHLEDTIGVPNDASQISEVSRPIFCVLRSPSKSSTRPTSIQLHRAIVFN